MDVCIAGTDHDAIVVVEQQVAVQRVGPGLYREPPCPAGPRSGRSPRGKSAKEAGLSRLISPCSTYTAPATAALSSKGVSIIQFFKAT